MSIELPTTAELLLAYDAQRPRSRQQEIGISDLGACRRQVGYRLAGYPVNDPKGSIQAVIGSAIHDAAAHVLRQMRAEGVLPPDAVIEQEVRFGGVVGHPDLYVHGIVRDIKSLGFNSQLDKYRVDGPPRRHRWQAAAYGAALRLAGLPVHLCQIDYIVRDSGDSWLFEEPFDVALVKEAFDWLRDVRDTELDFLSRDFAPDSAVCLSCPFYEPCWGNAVPERSPWSALYVEDPDALGWYRQLEDARARLAAAKADEKRAKGALDALRPNTKGRGEVQIGGAEKVLRWTVGKSSRLDGGEIRQDYARGGGRPPVVEGETIKLTLVAPRKEKKDAQTEQEGEEDDRGET